MTAGPPQSADDRVGLRGALSDRVLGLQSDRRLIRLARSGSHAAFAVIVERYRGPLLGYCGRLLGPDEAEDAVQQTFANALRALQADERPIDLRPWLYRIAHNQSVNFLNRRGRDYEQLDEQYDGVPQPPDLFEQKQRLERVVTAIDDLPDRQRQAIIAREFEGQSHDEIARTMEATTPVVRQLIHRARTRLRDACGVLVPIPWLRWLLASDVRAPGASERLGEAVAGGSAGAGLFKTGAILLTTGAVATGGGGIIAEQHHAHRHDGHGSAAARVQVAEPSHDTSTGAQVKQATAPRGNKRGGSAPAAAGDGSGSAPARAPRRDGEHGDRRQGDHHQGDAGDKSAPDEGDTASEPPREASHQRGDDGGDQGDGEHGTQGSGGSDGGGDAADPPAPPKSGSGDESPIPPDLPAAP